MITSCCRLRMRRGASSVSERTFFRVLTVVVLGSLRGLAEGAVRGALPGVHLRGLRVFSLSNLYIERRLGRWGVSHGKVYKCIYKPKTHRSDTCNPLRVLTNVGVMR